MNLLYESLHHNHRAVDTRVTLTNLLTLYQQMCSATPPKMSLSGIAITRAHLLALILHSGQLDHLLTSTEKATLTTLGTSAQTRLNELFKAGPTDSKLRAGLMNSPYGDEPDMDAVVFEPPVVDEDDEGFIEEDDGGDR